MTVFWRIAHSLYKAGRLFWIAARFFEMLNYILGSNAISAKAEIGKGTCFWHRGLGCIVHYKAVIGENCRILPNVMIGSKFERGLPDAKPPRIGNNVFIGAGAILIGNITIGDNAIIGANTLITEDVPNDCYAVGIPTRLKKRTDMEAQEK